MNRLRAWCAAPGILILLTTPWALAQDSAKDKKDAKPATPNYYPLEAGTEWHYSVSANGNKTKIVTRIAKIETIDGVQLARLESQGAALTEHLIQNDKGVFRARFNGSDITPHFKLIPYPVKLGTKWQGTFTVQGDDAKNEYEGEIAAKEETIEVPAGKFKTIRVRIKLERDGQRIDTIYWFAKDVGFVRQSLDVGGTSIMLELDKVERKKKGAEPKKEPEPK